MKKSDVQAHVHVHGAITNYEALLLIFELESGSQIEFSVGDNNFKSVHLYEHGELAYKGKNFIKFESACIKELGSIGNKWSIKFEFIKKQSNYFKEYTNHTSIYFTYISV